MGKNSSEDMGKNNLMDGYEKIDNYNDDNVKVMAGHYRDLLGLIGEDPEREGLKDSPVRVAKSLQFLTHGYLLNPEEILKSAMFKEDYKEMVLVKNIEI